MTRKVIVIPGATGAQGGGLARAILDDPDGGFAVRALTRDPGSDKAKALAAAGAEVVEADVDDVESLKRAFRGASAAYCISFPGPPEQETSQGRNQAAAAKHAGVAHVIWSTFEDTRDEVRLSDDRMPTLRGKYKVPHFDAKADANHFFSDAGLQVTFLYSSFYWENFIFAGVGPKRGPDGRLTLTLPLGDTKLPGMASEDIGRCAYGVFKRGQDFVGKTVGVTGEHLTGSQLAAELTKALDRTVVYNTVTPEVFRSFGFPGADDVGNMFQFKAEFQNLYLGNRPPALSRELNPRLQTFAQWLAVNKGRIPLQ